MADHYYMEKEVICPHCDCEQYDSHEFDDDCSYECNQCNQSFNVTIRIKSDMIHTEIRYSTTRIGRAENE